MMLVTATCEPPSCAARLPQKFSAATTVIGGVPEELCDAPVVATGVLPFPQPARSRASPAPRAAQRAGSMLALMTRIIIRMILIATGGLMLRSMEQDLHATVAGHLRRY